MKMLKLGELVEIYSGQIMSRIVVDSKVKEKGFEFRVVTPKAISQDGLILKEELPTEMLKAVPDSNRITSVGDIVIKLSTPYDSAIITEEFAGCVIPSFCAVIRNINGINKDYLQAFLSSKLCKEQLKSKVVGSIMTILSVGKIKDIEVPVPSLKEQEEIGARYIEVQNRVVTLKKIVELESKRNDILFNNMVNL